MKNNVTLNIDKQDFISFFDEIKQKTEIKRKMSAISIDTKTYKFNRDEANER